MAAAVAACLGNVKRTDAPGWNPGWRPQIRVAGSASDAPRKQIPNQFRRVMGGLWN